MFKLLEKAETYNVKGKLHFELLKVWDVKIYWFQIWTAKI